MTLTRTEEANLIKRFDPYLRKMVNIYAAGVKWPTSGQRADLMQEARLALLAHIRRMESMDQIYLCHIHVIRAMCRHKERLGLLYIPHNLFEKVRPRFRRVDVEILSDMPDAEEDALFMIMLNAFLDTLAPSERTAFTMKLDGHTNREIMRAIGLRTDAQASRLIKKLASKYRRYAGDSEEVGA